MVEVVLYGSGGAVIPMRQLCDVSEVRWETGWGNGQPGGCQEASWAVDLPPNSSHPDLVPGRLVEVWDGGSVVYAGQLREPDRGEPWRMYASGLSAAGGDFLCLDAAGAPSSVPNTVVDQAIIRGLPWYRHNPLSSAPFTASATTVDLNRVTSLLDAWSEESGQRWGVFADRILTVAADPTTPTWALTGSAGVMGVADDEFATHIYARYVSAVDPTTGNPTTWGTVTVSDADAATRWGRREQPLDLTPLGLMNATRATSLAQGRLTLAGQRMGWTNGLQVSCDDLTSIGGVPARLSQVKAGDMLRIFQMLDQDGNLAFGQALNVVIGHTDYTDGADTIRIDPVGMVPRSLTDVLATPEPAADRFTDHSSL